MSITDPPTLAGFTNWVYTVMGVPQSALPPNSSALVFAYDFAIAIVNPALGGQMWPCYQQSFYRGPLYTAAVYNLGADNLINYAPDTGTTTPATYWATLRSQFKINSFVAGVISSTSDQSTSESLEVSEFAKNFTLSDLQNLKTPYGRQYLAIAMRFGSLWGIS